MLFNSIDFAIFFPIVFFVYWFVLKNNLRFQNILIVAASYLFYGWWDWRFLSLILFSTIVDYIVGLKLNNTTTKFKRKLLLFSSIFVNLGFLGFFKYFNFFIENFENAFTLLGMNIKATSLEIILPVGISFYTFQTLSYTIDVYKNKLKPTNDFIAFSAFVSFFPQLVAGPIERATNLIPQFLTNRKFVFEDAVYASKLIIWGFFMKLVVADRLAIYVDAIYNNYQNYSSITLIVATIFFAFQIYCDFAGYSNIAIGTARLFGFKLMTNFRRPYFASNPSEFWRRWHISLSTWFRDYLYIPLGGSRYGKNNTYRNLMITFTVSGLWHGANWTFVFWGALNGFYQIIYNFFKQKNKKYNTIMGGFLTFVLINLTWVFFRADSIFQAFEILYIIFFKYGNISILSPSNFTYSLIAISILLTKDIFDEYNLKHHYFSNRYYDFLFYYFIIIMIILIGVFDGSQFIYFRF